MEYIICGLFAYLPFGAQLIFMILNRILRAALDADLSQH